jgi:PAS domain S-box-containing protein
MSIEEVPRTRKSKRAFFRSRSRDRAESGLAPALDSGENDLKDFFDNGPIGLHLVAADGTILRANRAELQLLGYSADEYVGRNIAEFHVDQPVLDEILSCLLENGRLDQRPARLRAKDGSIKHVLISSNSRMKEGEFVNTRCFTIDVTDRVRAEEMLREHDKRLAATYEHAAIGISEIDREGRLLWLNTQFCNLLGYPCEELVGRVVFDFGHSDDADLDRQQFRRQVAGELDSYSIEKRIKRKDGTHFWALLNCSSVTDAEGQFLYAVRIVHDITDRKRAEEALARKMEEQAAIHAFTEALQHADSLDTVYERALDAIVRALRCDRASILLFDGGGVMRFVAWRRLSDGYRRAVEGHSPWAPDDANPLPVCLASTAEADIPDSLKATVAAESIQAVAFIPLRQHGRLLGKFMAYYDRPHAFSADEIEVAQTIARQLGFGIERMRAEEARRSVERAAQQLVSIVESSDDAIISKDLNGVIITWNKGAERLFGYTAEEAVGRSVTMLIPDERLDEEPEILSRIRRGEPVDHYETVRRCKDGTLVDISLTVSPMRDASGRVVGASKIARDITERKLAEAKIRENEHHLQELLAAIPAAIYTTDAQGRVTYFNQAAIELAGRTPVLGSDEWCVTWRLYRPDGTPLPHDQCPMAVALKEGRPIRNAEAIAERPDGVRIPFIPYPTPLRDEKGRITGAINMLVDISERKQAETQQRMLVNELNHRVKNNMQMLQSLLYSAATRTESAEARRILGEAAGRISAMAAAQRVLYGTADATRFSAEDFVNAVCQTVSQTFPKAVEVVCEADSVQLSNDIAMPLALILNELLTNAVKHGMNGGEKGTIRVRLAREGDGFRLVVEDDGPGFDLTSVRSRSSGLGLVQGLARQLRAEFEVTRDPGTRCTLSFA